jgi:RNA polymerase sigma-70 factor (ECF subfamily)
MSSDKDISALARRSPEGATKMLFEKYSDWCFVLSMRYLNIQEEAEEAVMNAYLKIHNNWSKFSYREEGSLKAWVKAIVINECLMQLRKTKLVLLNIEEANMIEEKLELPEFGYSEILELISKLPIHLRTVFNLYEIEGYSHKEIAEMLGCSEGTSKSNLSRAKVKLRGRLAKLRY